MKNNKLTIITALLSLVIIGLGITVVMLLNDDGNTVNVANSEIDYDVSNASNDIGDKDNNDTSYYEQITEYVFKMEKFLKYTYSIVQNKEINEFNQEQYLKKTNRFILYSDSFQPTPVTEQDSLLHDEFMDMKYDMDMIAEYTLKYIRNQDEVDRALHKDYYEELLVHLSTLKYIEEEYH